MYDIWSGKNERTWSEMISCDHIACNECITWLFKSVWQFIVIVICDFMLDWVPRQYIWIGYHRNTFETGTMLVYFEWVPRQYTDYRNRYHACTLTVWVWVSWENHHWLLHYDWVRLPVLWFKVGIIVMWSCIVALLCCSFLLCTDTALAFSFQVQSIFRWWP